MGSSILTCILSFILTLLPPVELTLVECYQDAEHLYVYDSNDNVYEYIDGFYVLINNDNIKCEPALTYIPVHKNSIRYKELFPHCYYMSFEDACAVITRATEDGYDLAVTCRTPDYVDMLLDNGATVARCVIERNSTFRIYTENPDDFKVFSTYIIER